MTPTKIVRASFNALRSAVQRSGLSARKFDEAVIEIERRTNDPDGSADIDVMTALHVFFAFGAALQFITKQLVWGLGDILHGHLLACSASLQQQLAPQPAPDQPDVQAWSSRSHMEAVAIADTRSVRARKLVLHHYTQAMRMVQAECGGRVTTCIDAAVTKSRQKRFFMAVGTTTNKLGWAPPQAAFALTYYL